MSKHFHLTLASLDVGQLLDGLRSRQTSWRNTATFLREDYYFPDDAHCKPYTPKNLLPG